MPTPRHRFAVRTPPAAPGARIGLLGGSFNPAHEGHLLISRIALRRLRLDQVWWIVSPANPLKSHADLASVEDRLGQARGMAGSRIIVTGFETSLASPYTVDTLHFLQTRYPRTRFVWLMGADNLVQMPRWRRWRSIFETMPVAIVDRPGWHLAAHASRASRAFARARVPTATAASVVTRATPAWVFLTGPLSVQSSSAIRAARRRM